MGGAAHCDETDGRFVTALRLVAAPEGDIERL
jgi:hypothetical protein